MQYDQTFYLRVLVQPTAKGITQSFQQLSGNGDWKRRAHLPREMESSLSSSSWVEGSGESLLSLLPEPSGTLVSAGQNMQVNKKGQQS